jgi:hypothetical protein
MKDFEKEFYAHLGMLSTKYAKMEYYLSNILGKLIGVDEESINVTLVENNTLHQNITMLKKINKIRKFESFDIDKVIELIGQVKNGRNRFIHGIWGNPFKEKDEINVVCDERKIRYTEQKDENGKLVSQNWQYNENYIYSLTYIKKQINVIENIIVLQDSLIDKLIELDYF